MTCRLRSARIRKNNESCEVEKNKKRFLHYTIGILKLVRVRLYILKNV